MDIYIYTFEDRCEFEHENSVIENIKVYFIDTCIQRPVIVKKDGTLS